MVVGNGLLAKIFASYKEDKSIVFFASGVSNSNNTNSNSFDREKKLLIETIERYKEKTLVYFSSCDVIYAEQINKLYYFHKLDMEKIIQENVQQYYIFRLPQTIGYSNNPNSLINFFIMSIKEQKELPIWEYSYKNLIDVDDVYELVVNVINKNIAQNKIVNIINPNYYSILEIVKVIENILKKNAKLLIKKEGYRPNYFYDRDLLNSKISFDSDYLETSIRKHYKNI